MTCAETPRPTVLAASHWLLHRVALWVMVVLLASLSVGACDDGGPGTQADSELSRLLNYEGVLLPPVVADHELRWILYADDGITDILGVDESETYFSVGAVIRDAAEEQLLYMRGERVTGFTGHELLDVLKSVKRDRYGAKGFEAEELLGRSVFREVLDDRDLARGSQPDYLYATDYALYRWSTEPDSTELGLEFLTQLPD